MNLHHCRRRTSASIYANLSSMNFKSISVRMTGVWHLVYHNIYSCTILPDELIFHYKMDIRQYDDIICNQFIVWTDTSDVLNALWQLFDYLIFAKYFRQCIYALPTYIIWFCWRNRCRTHEHCVCTAVEIEWHVSSTLNAIPNSLQIWNR